MKRSYLDYLSKLGHDDLDKDYDDLPIHDHKLPVVRFRHVAIIEEAVLSLNRESVQIVSVLHDQCKSISGDSKS